MPLFWRLSTSKMRRSVRQRSRPFERRQCFFARSEMRPISSWVCLVESSRRDFTFSDAAADFDAKFRLSMLTSYWKILQQYFFQIRFHFHSWPVSNWGKANVKFWSHAWKLGTREAFSTKSWRAGRHEHHGDISFSTGTVTNLSVQAQVSDPHSRGKLALFPAMLLNYWCAES